MKKLFLILICLGLGGFSTTLADFIYAAGDVSGTWSADTVIVTAEVRVPPSETLTIEPGVEVLFFGYCKFIVDGSTLIAVGTENDSIRFDEYSPGGNNWKGIRFLYASASSRLEYCHLTNGWASGGGEDSKGGAIYCSNSSPTIVNCLIDNCSADDNGGGIYCHSSSPTISGNTISGNSADWGGGGISCFSDSNPTISGNTISGNSASDGGGIVCWDSSPTISGNTISENTIVNNGGGINCYGNSDPTISGNTISGNSANQNSGGIYCTGSSPTISGNTISENTAVANGGGIHCDNNSNPTIVSNKINGNTATTGGGIYCSSSLDSFELNEISLNTASGSGGGIYLSNININPTLNKNTIVYNTANLGGGLYCDNYSSPSVINCILWNNSLQQMAQSAGSNAVVTYSDIGQFWPGIGNINADPLFYSTTGDSAYYLTVGSPCIDAGDPSSPLDPDSTIADMGAYYYHQDELFEYQNSVEITGEITAAMTLIDDGNIAALDQNAADDYDPGMDIPKPAPPPSDYLSVYFPHPEWGVPIADDFMIDVRNGNDDLTNDVKVYEFEINTDQEGETVNLTFTIGDEYPVNYGAVLYDQQASIYQNLRENDQYSFTAGADIHNFNLRLGDGTEPDIDITFPASNTTLYGDSSVIITWETTDVSPIRYSIVYYSLDNGSSWTFIDSVINGAQNCSWTVPDTSCTIAKLKVEAEDWAGNWGYTITGYTFNIIGSQNLLSGPLSGIIEAGEYHVIGDISVQSGDSLTIEPGAVLLFDGNYQFDIYGYLYAVGTEVDSIKLMPDGFWRSIPIESSPTAKGGWCCARRTIRIPAPPRWRNCSSAWMRKQNSRSVSPAPLPPKLPAGLL